MAASGILSPWSWKRMFYIFPIKDNVVNFSKGGKVKFKENGKVKNSGGLEFSMLYTVQRSKSLDKNGSYRRWPVEKGIIKVFANFTGKHLYCSPNTGVYLSNFQNF